MHDHYDVIPFFDDSNAKNNFLWQIQSNLAALMKAHYKLPEKIIIILNNSSLDDTAFAITQLAKLLQWLFKEIEAAINYRRRHLPVRCLKKEEPAVYLIKMLPRAARAENSEIFKSTRRKINHQIPVIAEKFEYGFINVCEITTTDSLMYDRTGKNLAPAGILQFWQSVSETIKEINEDKAQKAAALSSSLPPENQQQLAKQKSKSPARDNRKANDSNSFNRTRGPRPYQYQQRRHSYDYPYDYHRYHYSAPRKY